jgi:hypothetical protein
MSLMVCWAANGGSGSTVVAAALALGAVSDSLLVDLDRHLPLALGVAEPAGQGLRDWFESDVAPSDITELLDEPGRSLGVEVISKAIGAPIVDRVAFDPAVCRAVCSGLRATGFHIGIVKAVRVAV